MKITQFLKKIKISFKILRKTDLLIFSGWENDTILNKIFNKYKFYYIRRLDSEINVPCLIIATYLKIKNKCSINENYFRAAIILSRPKLLITTYDNYTYFYKFKNSLNIQTAFLQTSYNKPYKDYLSKEFKKNGINKNYFVDHMFVWGKSIKKELKKYIQGKFYTSGSFRNNSFPNNYKKKTKVITSITFISQYRKIKSISQPVPSGKTVKCLDDYCLKNKILLKILLYGTPHVKGRACQNYNDELNFYNNLNLKCDYKILVRSHVYESYKILIKQDLIITNDSSLGQEMLARGKKVVFFGLRHKIFHPMRGTHMFGWPSKFSNKGPFWLDYYAPSELFKIISRISKMKNSKWNQLIKQYQKKLIIYDYKNKYLIKKLSSIIN